jgi:flagellar basal body rod protein FlgG
MNISLYQAASALNANARWQEVIAENLASSSTPGFRKQELTVEAVRAGLLPAQTQASNRLAPPHFTLPNASLSTNFTPGELRYTGSITDLAIEGPGFFEVQLANGSSAYTRDGEFRLNAQGQLTTKQGYPVLGDSGLIQIDPNNPAPIVISPSGEVSQGTDQLGRIRPVNFDQPSLLQPISGALFLAQDPNLTREVTDTSTLRQGWLEGANTTVSDEMASLLTAMRTFEANQRVIQIQDERMAKAIEELGNP